MAAKYISLYCGCLTKLCGFRRHLVKLFTVHQVDSVLVDPVRILVAVLYTKCSFKTLDIYQISTQ